MTDDRTSSTPPADPTVPPLGRQWPAEWPRTVHEDHAVLAWIAIEGELSGEATGHLFDALLAWQLIVGRNHFPVEPKAGTELDLRQVLLGIWNRRLAQAELVCWEDKIILSQVAGHLGLAIATLTGTLNRPDTWSSGGTVGRCHWATDGNRSPGGVVVAVAGPAVRPRAVNAAEAAAARRVCSATRISAVRRAAAACAARPCCSRNPPNVMLSRASWSSSVRS